MKSLLQYPTNKVATISDTIKITSTINIYLYILFLIDKNLCFEKYTETAHIEAYFSKQNLREVLGNEVICKKTIGRLS